VLGVDAAESPEFTRQLEDSLASVCLHPEQLLLPMELPEESGDEPGDDTSRRQPSPRPKPIIPPLERFRVEIWRESKKGKKSVTVTAL
jgi:hypothetical protein